MLSIPQKRDWESENTHASSPSEISAGSGSIFRIQSTQSVSRFSQASKPFYQISFLNKLCRVFPNKPRAHDTGREQLELILKMLIAHFEVKMWLIEQAHLVEVESQRIIWHDDELQSGGCYFLAFTRVGCNLTQTNLPNILSESPESLGLLSKALFSRQGKAFRIKNVTSSQDGKIEDIRIEKSHGTSLTFLCPLMDCGKSFKRSCDLTGSKPFTCEGCGHKFRRKILLKKHARTCIGLRQAFSQLEQPQGPQEESGLGKLMKCQFCTKIFHSQSDLHGHLVFAHKKAKVEEDLRSYGASQVLKNWNAMQLLKNVVVTGLFKEQDVTIAKVNVCIEMLKTQALLGYYH